MLRSFNLLFRKNQYLITLFKQMNFRIILGLKHLLFKSGRAYIRFNQKMRLIMSFV